MYIERVPSCPGKPGKGNIWKMTFFVLEMKTLNCIVALHSDCPLGVVKLGVYIVWNSIVARIMGFLDNRKTLSLYISWSVDLAVLTRHGVEQELQRSFQCLVYFSRAAHKVPRETHSYILCAANTFTSYCIFWWAFTLNCYLWALDKIQGSQSELENWVK